MVFRFVLGVALAVSAVVLYRAALWLHKAAARLER